MREFRCSSTIISARHSFTLLQFYPPEKDLWGKRGYIFRKTFPDTVEKSEMYDPVGNQTLNSSNIQSIA
jgi:hypothetical protein